MVSEQPIYEIPEPQWSTVGPGPKEGTGHVTSTAPTASPYSRDPLWGLRPEKDTAPLSYVATPEHEAWVRGLIREELGKREKGVRQTYLEMFDDGSEGSDDKH